MSLYASRLDLIIIFNDLLIPDQKSGDPDLPPFILAAINCTLNSDL